MTIAPPCSDRGTCAGPQVDAAIRRARPAFRALRSDSPFGAFRSELLGFWRSRRAGFALFLFLAMFQGAFTSIKVMMPEFVPFTFDPALADLDELIHFGPAWEHLRFLDGYTALVRFLYTPVWILIYTGATLLMCLSRPSPDGDVP